MAVGKYLTVNRVLGNSCDVTSSLQRVSRVPGAFDATLDRGEACGGKRETSDDMGKRGRSAMGEAEKRRKGMRGGWVMDLEYKRRLGRRNDRVRWHVRVDVAAHIKVCAMVSERLNLMRVESVREDKLREGLCHPV
ncbi:hypothetical protein GOBAR_DD34634 [Gossypium barbadense]|nr:hypothetical protein GOBAR_DD34634 [Gossypium barbadense]